LFEILEEDRNLPEEEVKKIAIQLVRALQVKNIFFMADVNLTLILTYLLEKNSSDF
jgi:hypothetical protein